MELEKAIEELKEKARDGWVILVEGMRDYQALRELGIEGEIVLFSGIKTAELLAGKKVILLTDFDREGDKIEKFFRNVFYGKLDVDLRRKIFKNAKVKRVEELLYEF